MTRIIDLSTATGIDLDEFGRVLDTERLTDPLECDSHYRKRLVDENEQRKLKRTPKSDMTLRDYFAAKAMQSLLYVGAGKIGSPEGVEGLASASFIIADAMLRGRAK